MMPESTTTDPQMRRLERRISDLLRVGVLLSLGLIVLGSTLTFLHHPEYGTSGADLARLTHPGAAFPHTWGELTGGLMQGHGQSIVLLGLLVLIATPFVRVGVSVIAFLRHGDRVYALITLGVLVLLLLSLALGGAG